MDVTFTAQMEDDLETHIPSQAERCRPPFLGGLHSPCRKSGKRGCCPKVTTDLDCPKCGQKLQKIWAKKWVNSDNYPSCDYTAPIV